MSGFDPAYWHEEVEYEPLFKYDFGQMTRTFESFQELSQLCETALAHEIDEIIARSAVEISDNNRARQIDRTPLDSFGIETVSKIVDIYVEGLTRISVNLRIYRNIVIAGNLKRLETFETKSLVDLILDASGFVGTSQPVNDR